jgi:SagB-type dehydrogenase family enzyme
MSVSPEDSGIARTPIRASRVYGQETLPLDDAAEEYHEASSWYPTTQAWDARGGGLLEADPKIAEAVSRAAKRYDHRPETPLPAPGRPAVALSEVLDARRSGRDFGSVPVALAQLSTVLAAAYGERPAEEGRRPRFRRSPSAGALYPLEVFAFLIECSDAAPGLYHFDPERHALESVRPLDREALHEAFVGDAVQGCHVVVALAGIFWRSRFKYGLRGYRFTLLEAGHVAQNLLLTATALGLPAVPLGGFYDLRLNRVLQLDGVNEACVYAVALGGGES